MKKGYLILIIILIVIVTMIAAALYIGNKEDNNIRKELYKEEYTSSSWGYANYGYIIYNDGTIQQFDNSTNKRIENPIKANLTKSELNKLIKLANKVSDNFEEDNNSIIIADIGTTEIQIYNAKIGNWIVLSKVSSYERGTNNTDVAKEIFEFTEELENKYLNNK